jgi:hypothetical protein
MRNCIILTIKNVLNEINFSYEIKKENLLLKFLFVVIIWSLNDKKYFEHKITFLIMIFVKIYIQLNIKEYFQQIFKIFKTFIMIKIEQYFKFNEERIFICLSNKTYEI